MKNRAVKIVQTLRDHDYRAFFVGGCVRDMLMRKEPGDYDIVTNASPQQIRQLFPRTVPVGAQFGIVLVVMNGIPFEVAQFRGTSGGQASQNHHDIAAILRDDAAHRDFTINGMFYDPFTEKVFDYVEGQQDIAQGVIRAIHSPVERFEEDRLRILRAIRFAASLGYQIEPETCRAITAFAPRIREVSIERIREEMLKILLTPRPEQGLRLVDATGMLATILPEVSAMQGVSQPAHLHPEGDVFQHTMLMLRQLGQSTPPTIQRVSPELAMGVLLHDVGKPQTYSRTADGIHFYNHARVGAEMTAAICNRFKFSASSKEKIVTLVKDHLRFFDVKQMKKSTLKRFLRQEHIQDLLELHRLDCLGSHGDLNTYQFCLAKLEEFQHESVRPPRLISGKDLITLGFEPGPVFKEVLGYIEDAQLEGIVSTRNAALELARDIQDALT